MWYYWLILSSLYTGTAHQIPETNGMKCKNLCDFFIETWFTSTDGMRSVIWEVKSRCYAMPSAHYGKFSRPYHGIFSDANEKSFGSFSTFLVFSLMYPQWVCRGMAKVFVYSLDYYGVGILDATSGRLYTICVCRGGDTIY